MKNYSRRKHTSRRGLFGGSSSGRAHGVSDLGELVKTPGGAYKIESASAAGSGSSMHGGRKSRKNRKSRTKRRGGNLFSTASVPFSLLGLLKLSGSGSRSMKKQQARRRRR
jgi:hypothetical protein